MRLNPLVVRVLTASMCLFGASASAQLRPDRPPVNPSVTIDLRSTAGTSLVRGAWKVSPVRFETAAFNTPGPDRKPSGPPGQTWDIQPHAEAIAFDDSAWQTVAPESLEDRRGGGMVSAEWYRISITLPESVAGNSIAGTVAALEITVDDYAEVWVDGQLPEVLGSVGGGAFRGWNAPSRVVLSRDARPGQTIQVAIFAMNGPVSKPPSNYIWVRQASVDFYDPASLRRSIDVPVEVARLDPAIDEIVPPGAKLERLAEGFTFVEGPVWVPANVAGAGARPLDHGYLLFSEPNSNVIHRYDPFAIDGPLSVFRSKSGYSGPDIREYGQPGSNGLTLDSDGRLTICEHGNRRVTRIEHNGTVTVLADAYQGKRLNSPNDLVYRSDGTLYFTDPPFGLPKFHDDPRRETPHYGVYCIYNGQLKLLTTEFTGPNGLAFSPDEKSLYIGTWEDKNRVVKKFAVSPDGSLADSSLFYDFNSAPGSEAIDGVKVDTRGNVYVSVAGGIWIISADGKHLGTIRGPELPANFTFGDDDGRTLYMTARTGLYRMRVGVEGIRPLPKRN